LLYAADYAAIAILGDQKPSPVQAKRIQPLGAH
jgi:hypothetical protein